MVKFEKKIWNGWSLMSFCRSCSLEWKVGVKGNDKEKARIFRISQHCRIEN